jgi:hypothetical protein
MSGFICAVSPNNGSPIVLSAEQDILEITVTEGRPCQLVGLTIAQVGTADMGDAQDESVMIRVICGFTTPGNGSTTGREFLRPADPSPGFTARFGLSTNTLANAGSPRTVLCDAFNVRAGYQFWWPAGVEPTVVNTGGTSQLAVVRLSAPADPINIVATLYVRELR